MQQLNKLKVAAKTVVYIDTLLEIEPLIGLQIKPVLLDKENNIEWVDSSELYKAQFFGVYGLSASEKNPNGLYYGIADC